MDRARIRKQVIKNLIEHYKSLNKMNAEEMKELSDIEYEIVSGRNHLIANYKETPRTEKGNLYNDMRGKVDNCTEVFESKKMKVYENESNKGDIFEKPQFFLWTIVNKVDTIYKEKVSSTAA